MKKPDLLVTALTGLVPTEGTCTSCPSEKFRVTKPPEILDVTEAKMSLVRQFNRHFEQVHRKEDASQAAARIVREATEDR